MRDEELSPLSPLSVDECAGTQMDHACRFYIGKICKSGDLPCRTAADKYLVRHGVPPDPEKFITKPKTK